MDHMLNGGRMEKVHMGLVDWADSRREERRCGNQAGKNKWLGRFSWQGHSLPIDHMELACKGVGRERTCLSSKAVWLVSFRTAGIARSRNPGHNPGQKTSQQSVKARRAERKSFCPLFCPGGRNFKSSPFSPKEI